MTEPILEARRVSKRFGDVAAIDHVNFDVRPGEVHAICGENGAGKSTLIRVLSGYYPARSYDGDLLLDGKPLRLNSVRDGEAAGIAVIHQELTIIPELTVAENLFLGRLPTRGPLWDWATTIRDARQILQRFDLALDPETSGGHLGIAQQQLVEIGRALARHPRVLILDEPTAALSEVEVQQLLEIVSRLRADGVACIYISHKLDEVKQIADRITILRDGRTIMTDQAERCSTNDIIRNMVGREIDDVYPRRRMVNRGDVLLEVVDLSVAHPGEHTNDLSAISLKVKAGEILGIGGLMGAGRSELLMHLYGLWGQRQSGTVHIKGQAYAEPAPQESIRRGIMLLTEDRKRFGLLPTQTALENASLSSLDSVSTCGWIDAAAEQQRGGAMLEKTRFRALSDDVLVDRLSGGNQQKVALARGLICNPEVILLDEPTRGVDVGARREIYQEIHELADQGKAVVWVTSELPELMGVCDRIVIMRDGRTVACFERRAADGEFEATELMASAAGQVLA